VRTGNLVQAAGEAVGTPEESATTANDSKPQTRVSQVLAKT
jgi:hypothetical protein